eukprot:1878158-Rhodomonas_salina.1
MAFSKGHRHARCATRSLLCPGQRQPYTVDCCPSCHDERRSITVAAVLLLECHGPQKKPPAGAPRAPTNST